ncbi:MAG: tetraacyldisaccharide 4'-kinase [Nonlabens sp.]|uniref:tetraacyldisaccharide 4'-kinase n=1 Tax=Nonlabens sp. TaxID=1888209 RepID=UPI003EF1A035
MQLLRNLLFPFSVLYDGITTARNWAFEKGYLKQESFDVPVIVVGNLSTGGTGKTPMIEWLVNHHQGKKIAVLSRGYGRKTSGFIEINDSHTALEVGDEPLQIKNKFGDSIVSAVCEKRVDGIQKLLSDHSLDLILLDDAYQHRHVKASHYILLTSFDKPYYNDYLLPTGDLRESREGANRAHTIIVTKCPVDISDDEKAAIIKKIKPQPSQQVCFSTIAYDEVLISKDSQIEWNDVTFNSITAVTGIAKPAPFIDFLEKRFDVEHIEYGDHHRFRESEINDIKKKKMVITTEKDYTRLSSHELSNVYYVRMKMQFLGKKPVL